MIETLDVTRLRTDFPVLTREVRPGIPLIYLDFDRHYAETSSRLGCDGFFLQEQ